MTRRRGTARRTPAEGRDGATQRRACGTCPPCCQ